MDQRSLVERAQGGDVDAFEALVRLASGRLFGIAHRILRDHHLAEDAVQQTLVTIWDELPRLRDPDRFDAWTYRVIARASIAQLKRERRGGALLTLLPSDADVTETRHDDIAEVADRDRIERGFRRLDANQRAALVLQHYAGLSLAEIADVLGVPPGTAASRIHYATRALRAAIDADDRAGAATERSA